MTVKEMKVAWGLGHNAEDHSTEYSHLASETSMIYYEPGLRLIKTLDS